MNRFNIVCKKIIQLPIYFNLISGLFTIIIILGVQCSVYSTTKHDPKRPHHTVGNVDQMHDAVSHALLLAHGNSKGRTKGRSTYRNNCKIMVCNCRKLGLTSAKNTTLMLPERRYSSYQRAG